jgi:hypothetical protein
MAKAGLPVYITQHTRSHYAFSSTQQVHSQQQSKNRHGQDKHRQAKHHKQTPHKHYSTHSSVGTRMPALKLAPLHLANMPTRCNDKKRKKFMQNFMQK